MRIRISASQEPGKQEGALASLYRWLLRDPELAGVGFSVESHGNTGDQGAAFDIINALISDGVGVGGFVISYATWRQAHRSPTTITFERDGLRVQVKDASAETLAEVEQLLARVSQAPDTTRAPHAPDAAQDSADPAGS